MKVYAYKQFNDGYAYGEEIIELYDNKEAAVLELKKDVCKHFKTDSFDKLKTREEFGSGEDSTLKEDYVSYENAEGYCFWIVEEHELELTKASTFEVKSYNEEDGWITHASCTSRKKAEKAVKILEADDETGSIKFEIFEDDSIDTVYTSGGRISL